MRAVLGTSILVALLALTPAGAHAAEAVSGLAPAAPQPDPASLKPGLAVTYYIGEFNSTREIPEWAKYKDGVKGEPIPQLDYFVGDGEVLTSGRVDEVGADIRGFIRFPVAGTYTMVTQSNDGVDLSIGGQTIVKDTEVHADRFSDFIPVVITAPGWYPLQLWYFEKHNTSTLELHWQPPGASQMDFVPAEMFAHLP